jgi:hypothetical protein
MGPGLRRDDGFKTDNPRFVIPAKAGTHHPSIEIRVLRLPQLLQ